ncbi:hypothetical protein PF010_g29100 [Phytophthora fragariae]|uniref:Uncharacterized protein n=1 Tax=Phytophthora fragariae TaxID=53985 RepID=A0A6G0JPN3_9STRA|nr:hypothetical protein PF010_g29100 [Phytophthora fragariae]
MQVGIFEMHVKIHTQVRWHLGGAEIHEGVLLTRFMRALDDGLNSLSSCIPQPIQDRPWAPRRHAASLNPLLLYASHRLPSALRLSATRIGDQLRTRSQYLVALVGQVPKWCGRHAIVVNTSTEEFGDNACYVSPYHLKLKSL